MTTLQCKNCGETQNLHTNYAYHLPDTPVESILCNECGEITEVDGDCSSIG
jgi:Fe2+ or Zn2+ uptake regulation protein